MLKLVSALAVFTLFLTSPALAEIICGRVIVQAGKPKFTVRTVQTNSCPRGFRAILDIEELAGDLAAAGVPAGGALTGTYPNPGLAAGSVSAATLAPLPGARASRVQEAQSIPSNTPTDLEFDKIEYDTTGIIIVETPANQLLVPRDGVYLLQGQIGLGTTSGMRSLFFARNNQGNLGAVEFDGDITSQTLSVVTRLVAGDVVSLRIFHANGGLPVNTTLSAQQHGALAMQWLSP